MAIVNPEVALFDRGQTGTCTVTVTSTVDISGWAVTAILRTANGSTAIATKTVGSGITSSYSSSTQTWVITWSATDLDQEPGSYVWDFRRTDSGLNYQIIEPSALIIRPNTTTGGPTLTNLSEYLAHAFNGATPTAAMATQMTLILGAAEERVKRYCDRLFTKNTYIEYPVLYWDLPLVLTETPIQSITSLYLDYDAAAGQSTDPFNSSTLLTSGTDYFLNRDRRLDNYSDTGFIYRPNGGWSGGFYRYAGQLSIARTPVHGAVKCTYVGGYTLIPYDLKLIVWNTATIMRQFAPSGRLLQNWSGEGLSVGYGPMENAIRNYWSNESIIESYRRGSSRIG